jgi:hypothetical protein
MGGAGFQPIVQQRENRIRDILASQGLTRSGAGLQELAAVPLDTALDIEQMLTSRGQSLAGQGQTSGQGLAQLGQAGSTNIQQLLAQQGQAAAGGALGAAQAQAQGSQNVASLVGTVASLFSDKRMKKKIERIGTINGVTIYNFEPNELGEKMGMTMTKGVIADELQKTHPHLVKEADGYLKVDYEGTLKVLEAA